MKEKEYTHKIKGKTTAKAVHVSSDDGKHQGIGINLRVVILPDGKFWYAQGLEVDYGAQGDSVEDAKKNFEQGLSGTAFLHVKKYGNIERLLKRASSEVWKEARQSNASIVRFMTVAVSEIDEDLGSVFPYPEVEYYRPRAAAA